MSPPDIARATGHGLAAVDNYLGTYDRIKVLLKKGFDTPTICQVTGKAARTVAQYLVIVERFHPELMNAEHRAWLAARRERNAHALPAETVAPIMNRLARRTTQDTNPRAIVDPGASGEADRTPQTSKAPRTARRRRRESGQESLTGQMP